MIDGIIVVKQLPVIEERLKDVKTDIESRTSAAVAMDCTEENYKDVKKIRAELNKEYKEYEDFRKAVKKTVETPYKNFEEVFKECVTDSFKAADSKLKAKINNVEDSLKAQKRDNVLKFAEELKASYSLDWLNLNRVMPNVTLSTSESSLIQKASDTLEKINMECECINDPEIFAEYKKTLNLAQAKMTVMNRRKEIEQAKSESERKAKQEEAKQEAEKKVEMLAPPVVEESLPQPPKEEVKLYRMTFTVNGTKEQLKALKAFIIDNNIQIIGG